MLRYRHDGRKGKGMTLAVLAALLYDPSWPLWAKIVGLILNVACIVGCVSFLIYVVIPMQREAHRLRKMNKRIDEEMREE
jgi:hypothetical protein